MSEPVRPPEDKDDKDDSSLKSSPDGPPVNPTTLMMMNNTGIVLFAGAGIVFCLEDLMEAFLIAMLIIIALALGNLLLLTVGRRQRSYGVASAAGLKTGGMRESGAAATDWPKSQKSGR